MSIRKQKIEFFEKTIIDFFRKSGRSELPWRKKNMTPYEVWVSEIMLQQTQVNRVVEYYTKFLQKFPTVKDLARASWEEFLPYYEGLGYYARGRNMLLAAKIVTEKHKGVFPKERKELLLLPGVGDYTASAILSFGYGKNHLAWDTNLKRVIGRFFFGSKQADIPQEKFETFFDTSRKNLNAALMDFGSLICNGKPKCANCPLQKKCEYTKTEGTLETKKEKSKDIFPKEKARTLVFLHKNHKEYYSEQSKNFAPFLLPVGYQGREAIKDWFFQKYGLHLSVRPPHQKAYIDKLPVILVNAQILLGEHTFRCFSKKEVKEYTKSKNF